MHSQKAAVLEKCFFAESRYYLNNELSVAPAVSHFAVGWTEQQKNLSPVEDASQLALISHSLSLIAVRPSICHKIHALPDVVKRPGVSCVPSSQQGLVCARLALRSAHTRTNLIWPEGGFGDWWFHHVSSASAIWPGTTAASFVCGYVVEIHVCQAVTVKLYLLMYKLHIQSALAERGLCVWPNSQTYMLLRLQLFSCCLWCGATFKCVTSSSCTI